MAKERILIADGVGCARRGQGHVHPPGCASAGVGDSTRPWSEDRDYPRSVPAPVEGLNNAVAVAAGNRFSLALTGDGAVWAWGDNNYGQLGDGIPVAVTNATLRTNVVTMITYLTVTNYTQQTNYNYVTRQVVVTNAWPITTWTEHHYLDIVDYALASNPTVRPPVNFPRG